MGDVPVHHGNSPDDWTTGIFECCGGDGYGKAGDSAGATVCREIGLHQDNWLQSCCGCCGYSFLLYYVNHVSQHSPKPLLGGLLGESCKGCGCVQYDCAFAQNLLIVCICSCISMPFFRCKLREQYSIKGNIFFDCLACLLCGTLAPLQEFREAAIRDKKFSTLTGGGKFGTDEDLPEVALMVGDG